MQAAQRIAGLPVIPLVCRLSQRREDFLMQDFADLSFQAGGAELIPVPAGEGLESLLDVTSFLQIDHPAAFVFRQKTAVMQHRGILPGDFVVVRRDFEPREGDLIVVYRRGRYHLEEASFPGRPGPEPVIFFGTVSGIFRKPQPAGRRGQRPEAGGRPQKSGQQRV